MATKDKLINLEDLKVLSDHVEGEVTDLKSDLIDSNLFNPTKVENQYVRYSDGAILNSSSYSYMEATGISAYEALHVHTNNPKGSTAICFYDASGTWISSIQTTEETSPYLYDAIIDVPEGADIIRVSCLKAYLSSASLNTTLKEHLNALKETINEKAEENENKLFETVDDVEECTITIFFKTNSGYLGGAGAVNSATANQEVYTDFIPVTEGDIIHVNHATNTSGASMWFCYCLYDSTKTIVGSRIDLVSSVVRDTYETDLKIPSNVSYIRFTYRTFGTATLYLSKDWTTLNEKILNATNGMVEISTTWATGGISDSGAEAATSSLIRSDYIDLSNIGWITFAPVSGYRYCTRWYDENKVYLSDHEGNDESTLRTTGRYFDLTNDDAKYLRIVIGSTSSTNPTLADGDKAGEIAYNLFKGQVDALDKAVNIGSGYDFYNGEKIVLNNENVARYRCSIEKWKDFANISGYSLHLNQSMDIFNDYVFLLSDDAPTVILDYNTKSIVGTATMPQQSNSHYNSAQFSNIYYDADDEFPLLFTSQCNFNLEDACLIYRVTRNGTTFTFTLVNSIRINVLPTYQLSWAIDNYSKKLVCTGYYNGSYNVEDNNPIITYAWNIPSKTDIISGTQILLEPADAIEYSSIEHGTIQDIFCFNNKLFMGFQPVSGGRCVYVLDIAQNRIISKVTMTDAVRELEGVCIYDGKMFVCQKNGGDIAGTNPLTIWSVDFS